MSVDLSGGVSGQPGTPPVDPSTLLSQGPLSGSIFNDSLSPSVGLNVQTTVVDTTPGMPLLTWTSTISSATVDFKHLLYEAEQELELSQLDFAENVVSSMDTLLTVLNAQIALALAWNDPKTGNPVTVQDGYNALQTGYALYNAQVDSVNAADQSAINTLNQAYQDYENTPPSQLMTTQQQTDAIKKLNKAIGDFDKYVSNRPNLQSMYIQPIVDQTNMFNTDLGPINTQIQKINTARTSGNPPLSAYDLLHTLPVPNPQPEYLTINQQNAFTGPATPGDVTQYLSFFSQKPNQDRLNDLQSAIDSVANPSDVSQINSIIASFNPSSYTTEQALFTAIQTALGQPEPQGLGSTGTTDFDNAMLNPSNPFNPLGLPTTSAQIGEIATLPDFPGAVGQVPQLTLNDFMMSNFIPFAISLVSLIKILQGHLSLFQALLDQANFLKSNKVGYINFPSAFIQRTNRAFVGNVAAAGSGTGLGSFAVGLQTRHLESVLSNAITKAIAQHNNLPVAGQVFIRSLYTVLDILQKSSLLGSLPAASLFSNTLGWEGATDEAAIVGLAIGFSERLVNVIESNTSRALTNGTFNQISFASRLALQIAQDQVATGETQLQNAINNGDPDLINNAVSNLALADLQLSGATQLYNTFGLASVGGMAQVTDQVSATMNLSLLSVALAQFGQSIGLPGLVPQFFANFTGIPTDSIIGALSSGETIGDVLENPFNTLFLKQSLLDFLDSQDAANPNPAAAGMINNAIDNLVLTGDINTSSQLQAQLIANFRQQGFGQLDAFSLAAAATGIVLGGIGVNTLDAGFTGNVNAAAVASTVVNGINFNTGYSDLNSVNQSQLGQPDLATLLQGAIELALGIEMTTQIEFINQLAQGLGSSGLSQAASIFLANSTSSVITNGTAASGTGSSPQDIAALESSLATVIAHQFLVDVEIAAEIVSEALHHAFMTAPFSNPDQLNVAIKEGLAIAGGNAGLSNTQAVFDLALAALSNAAAILTVAGLLDQVTEAINGKAKGHRHMAQELNNAALEIVFGGTNVDEIQNKQNPLSLVNLLNQQVQTLTQLADNTQSDAIVQRLMQLLKAWSTPNAAIGYTLQSLTDHPSTVLLNLAMAYQFKGPPDSLGIAA